MPSNCMRAALALSFVLAASPAAAQSFKFSQPDESDRLEREARAARIVDYLSTPCRQDLRDKKIMVVIGEQSSDGQVSAQQQNYGQHYDAINNRLRALGLKTYTPEEIRRQIAQAEIDAQFRNDPDAALSASRRLGANFVLRGLISSQANRNPMMRVNQVSVTMGFKLTGSNGRLISTADAQAESYAGADVGRMALTLVNEQADEVVAKLYSDYCEKAGFAATVKSGKATKTAPK
jgi:acid stress-induced BolA-like protein IbaG/YrbA